MIRPPSDAEIVDAAEFVWKRCNVPASASYPLPETHGSAETSFRRTMEKENCALLCSFDASGEIDGALEYFFLPDEKYLQTTAFCADSDEAARGFLSLLFERHPGYTAHLGFPVENARMARLLGQSGFAVSEKSADLRLARAAFVPDADAAFQPERVRAQEYARYAPFHEQAFSESYWSAERIFAKPEHWIVYMLCADGAPYGSVYLAAFGGAAEIFGLSLLPGRDTPDAARALLSAALTALYAEHPKVNGTVYFAGENSVYELAAAKATGFTLFGRYRLYCKAL